MCARKCYDFSESNYRLENSSCQIRVLSYKYNDKEAAQEQKKQFTTTKPYYLADSFDNKTNGTKHSSKKLRTGGNYHDLCKEKKLALAINRKLILALAMFILIFSQLSSLTLQLKRVAIINQEEIRLIDLVESYKGEHTDMIKIQNILIDELPYRQRMINIPSNVVLQKIRLHNPNIQVNIPSVISAVRWNEETMSNERIQNEAREFLTLYYQLSEDAMISFMNNPRVTVPSDDVVLQFELSRTTENVNFIRLDGRVMLNGESIDTFVLTTRVQEMRSVLQANRSIRRGQKVSNSDFIRVTIPVNPNNNFVAEIDDFSDLVANGFISKGSYLRNTDIVGSPYVVANDIVTVIVQSATMRLNHRALARSNGWLGDRITLQNQDSRQTFHAQVVDRNTVLINLED